MNPRKLLLLLGLVALPVGAQDYTVEWWSVDGGGDLATTSGVWVLSGSIGQWDASEANRLSGAEWTLTGGFWALRAPVSDRVFADGFETP